MIDEFYKKLETNSFRTGHVFASPEGILEQFKRNYEALKPEKMTVFYNREKYVFDGQEIRYILGKMI